MKIQKHLRQAFLYWIALAVIGFLNGVLRVMVIMRFTDTIHAKQISSVLLIVWIALYVWLIFPKLDLKSPQQCIFLGGIWVTLTVIFESVMGFVSGATFEELFVEYNLLKGNLWGLILLFLFICPLLIFFHRQRLTTHTRV